MAEANGRENILRRIKEALTNPVPLPFPDLPADKNLFAAADADLLQVFESSFTKLQGTFFLCDNGISLQQKLSDLIKINGYEKIFCADVSLQPLLNPDQYRMHDLANCDASVTGCEFLIARTGTLVLSSAHAQGRTGSVYAPVHICVGYVDQLVADIENALAGLKEKFGQSLPSFISFASGPSRTADIEKTLVTGVHGPKEVYCFLTNRTQFSA